METISWLKICGCVREAIMIDFHILKNQVPFGYKTNGVEFLLVFGTNPKM